MALLISAGLFVKSLRNVSRVDLGHQDRQRRDVRHLAGAQRLRHTRDRAQLFARSRRSSRAIPGVTGVASAIVPLLAGNNWGTDVVGRGLHEGSRHRRQLALQRGRPRLLQDARRAAARRPRVHRERHAGAPKVAIVNEAFAKKFNLGRERRRQAHVDGGNDTLEHRDRRPRRRTRSTAR